MRRLLRVLAFVLVASGTVLVGLSAPAHAAQLADKGWWWKLGIVAPPAQVPEGGLYVQGAPDGAMAIAAVSFTLAKGETNPVLELKAAAGNPPAPPESILLACQAGATWTGESQGDWAAKPPPACDLGSVQGQVSDDGATWTFPLGPLQINDKVNVVLAPGVVAGRPEGLNGSTFQVAFDAPAASSLKTTPGTAPPPPPIAPSSVAAGVNEPTPESTSAPDTSSSFDPGPAVDTGAQAALPPEEQGITATAPAVQEQGLTPAPPAAAAPSDDDRARRALGFGVIILGVGAGFVATRVPHEQLRSLSRFGSSRPAPVPAAADALPPPEQRTGGLGRFARPRNHPAPQL